MKKIKTALTIILGVISTLTMLAQGYEELGKEYSGTEFDWPEGNKGSSTGKGDSSSSSITVTK